MSVLCSGSSHLVSCKYRDGHHAAPGCELVEPARPTLGERMPLYCVPLPGLTPWANAAVRDEATPSAAASETSPLKRTRDDDDGAVAEDSPLKRGSLAWDDGPTPAEAAVVASSFPVASETDMPCIVYVRV